VNTFIGVCLIFGLGSGFLPFGELEFT